VIKLKRLSTPEPLFFKLSEDILNNAGFLFRARDLPFEIFADDELIAAVAIQKDSDHCMFWGNWHKIDMPYDILPKNGIFVSACAPEIVEIMKQHFKLDGEWPCWHYLTPDNYGAGEWDELGPLTDEDVSFISPFWELSDDPEPHVKDRVARFDSACVRVGGKPVSWCGLHFEVGNIGNLGFAHTLDEYRRKGYAGLVTKALVNRLSARGMQTTSHVIKDNTASIKLCESLGFENIGEQTWAMFKRD